MNRKQLFGVFLAITLVAGIILLFYMLRNSSENQTVTVSQSGEITQVNGVEDDLESPVLEKSVMPGKTPGNENIPTTENSFKVPENDRITTSSLSMLRIYGFIKDGTDATVSGALVRSLIIENIMERRIGGESASAESNEKGFYEILVPAGKDYILIASASGYASTQRFVTERTTGGRSEIQIDFRLSPGFSISGVVHNTSGEGIPGVTVSPFRRGDSRRGRFRNFNTLLPPSTLSVQTDAGGNFVISGLYAGNYDLSAEKEEYAPAVKQGVPSPSENVEIVMEKGEGAVISGRVYYFGSGEAAADASVSVSSIPFTPAPVTVKSDREGLFAITGLIPGNYQIEAEKGDLESMPHEDIDLRETKSRTDVELKLFEGYTVSGRVFEQGGSKPVPGVSVSVRSGFRGEGISETTDDDGKYLISGILERRIFITAELEGYFQEGEWGPGSGKQLTLPNDRAEVENVDLFMSRGVKLSGKVVTKGEEDPIPGAEVRFITDARTFGRNRQNMITDAEGNFEGYAHNHSRLTVHASHRDYAEGSSNPITVSDKPVEDVKVELGSGGTAIGIVVDPDGEPVPDADVQGRAPTASATRRGRSVNRQYVKTGANGRFRIEKASSGEYLVSASAEGFSPSGIVSVQVPEGGESEEVTIELTSTHFISGFVVNEQGEPVPGAEVSLRYSRSWRRPHVTYSQNDGTFRFEGLRGGSYRIQATRGEDQSDWIEVESDTSEVEIVLKTSEFATLTGRVVDAETGDPVERFTLRRISGRGSWGNFNDPDGWFQVENLEKGRTYAFLIESPGYVTTRSPDVRIPAEGEPDEVTFSIGKGGSILGEVFEAGKGPLEGVKVTWLADSRWNMTAGSDQITFTDESGVFLCENMSRQIYIVVFEMAGFPQTVKETEVKSSDITDMGRINLKKGGIIRGRVMTGGEDSVPVPDKIVRLNSINLRLPITISYQTDAEGKYIFRDLPEGKYHVQPVGSEYSRKETEITSGQTRVLNFKPRN